MRRSLLLLLALGVASVAGAACSGGGGGGDSSTTPTPTPTSSLPPDSCQIVWLSSSAAATGGVPRWNMFLVDAPLADWQTGVPSYTVNSPIGVFYYGYDRATHDAEAAAVTTAGSFQLGLGSGTDVGGTVDWNDTTPQSFFALDLVSGVVGAQVASGGTGTFSGTWSDPAVETTNGGTGSVSVAWMGTNFSIGGLGSFAKCYHASALDRRERIATTISTVGGRPAAGPRRRARTGAPSNPAGSW